MTTRKNFKKRVSTITAVLLAAAMLLGATYAWNDTRQHKTNPFSATNSDHPEGMETREITLNNTFTPPSWAWGDAETEGQTTPNLISVSNMGASTTHTFVRLSLKQYMELRTATEDFYKDELGTVILFATFPDGPDMGKYMTVDDATRLGLNYGSFPIVTGVAPDGTETTQLYATTSDSEQTNGIYGKPMLKTELQVVWGGVPKAPINHGPQTPGKGECAYTPTIKGVTNMAGRVVPTAMNVPDKSKVKSIEEYVKIDWNTTIKESPNIITFKEWQTTYNCDWVDKWIYDDVKVTAADIAAGAQEGWVYWGSPLEPSKSTTDLINSVSTTRTDPMINILAAGLSGAVDYVVHTDMEAVSGFSKFYEADAGENKKGDPKTTEIETLFEPTLPKGETTDKPTVDARTLFFAQMKLHERESFADRASVRGSQRVVRHDLIGVKEGGIVPDNLKLRTLVDPGPSQNYFFNYQAPTNPAEFNGTGTQSNKKFQMQFKGWASSKTLAGKPDTSSTTAPVPEGVGTPDVARYNGTAFLPTGISLKNANVTRLYAVWEKVDVTAPPAP